MSQPPPGYDALEIADRMSLGYNPLEGHIEKEPYSYVACDPPEADVTRSFIWPLTACETSSHVTEEDWWARISPIPDPIQGPINNPPLPPQSP